MSSAAPTYFKVFIYFLDGAMTEVISGSYPKIHIDGDANVIQILGGPDDQGEPHDAVGFPIKQLRFYHVMKWGTPQ